MSNVLFLLSQYELLERLAQYLSTVDLINLALTCSEYYGIIRQSEQIFERLKGVALCDGRGLKSRQEFSGEFALSDRHFKWGPCGRKANYDEEVEVRVWNLRCDAANPLPCLRCNINVCEVCRYMPRVRDDPWFNSRRRPHLDGVRSNGLVICYCADCDKNVEADLPLRLSEYCDCDQYRRWICQPCKVDEDKPAGLYRRTRTKEDWEWLDDWDGDRNEIKWLFDHQNRRAYWCPCGEKAPRYGNVRCAWCRRRHNLDTWQSENDYIIPFFDLDPCFPKIAWDPQTGEEIMYPALGYTGPIAP